MPLTLFECCTGRFGSLANFAGRTAVNTGNSQLGKISEVTASGIAIPLASNLTYRPFGGPLGLTNGSGGVVNNEAGECDCVTVSNPGQPRERVYGYDANRNLTSITGTNTPWYSQAFEYDELNRLIGAAGRYGEISYNYDDVGNRLTRGINGTVETYTYAVGTNGIKEVTGGENPKTFTYDDNGNIISDGTLTFIYDARNQIKEVKKGEVSVATYTYNGLGQRVKKVVGDLTTVYHYDLEGKLIAESKVEGTVTNEYLYMGKIRVAMVEVATEGEALYHYLNERLGNPEILTDATGTVVWEAWYEPFGEAHIHPSSSVVNNHRFPGQYYDQETGFHYNYHRYYDPTTGRYLTPDPIGLEGGINLYNYVQNNPTTLIDPFGLKEFEMVIWIGGSVGYVIVGGGVYDVTIRDLETGETSLYTMKVFGLGVGLPSLRGSSRPIRFEVEDPCATAASFEGYGYVGGISVEPIAGFKVGGGIKIPQGPFIPTPMIAPERGGFDIGVSHNIMHWSRSSGGGL